MIIVTPPVGGKPTYHNWPAHEERLRTEYKIDVRCVGELDVNDVQTTCMFELASTMQVKDTKEEFQKLIDANLKKLDKYQRFAFAVKHDFSVVPFSFWYIVLCVVFLLDWWRWLLSWFTFHTRQHLRFTEIQHGGKHRRFASPHYSPWFSCCGYWAHGDRSPLQQSGNKCIMGPQPDTQGYAYYAYYMSLRDGVSGNGWRLWYLLCIFFYNVIGFAWYTYVFDYVLQFVSVTRFVIPQIVLDPIHQTRVIVFIIFVLLHWIVLSGSFRWRYAGTNFFIALVTPFMVPLVIPFLIWLPKMYGARSHYENMLDQEYNILDQD